MVLAVKQSGKLITDPPPNLVFNSGDELIVLGAEELNKVGQLATTQNIEGSTMQQRQGMDEQTITLESEDGRSYACRILGVFQFDNKEYALLLNMGEGESEEESAKDGASTVIMQLIEKDDQAIFRTIESDEEFEKVVAYVKELASSEDFDDDEEDDEEDEK